MYILKKSAAALRAHTAILLLVVVFFATVFAAQTAHANHFRSGFMSWESVDGEANTVLVKVEVGWTNDHGQIPTNTAIGDVVENAFTLHFGDGNSHSADVRVTSRNTTTNDVQTELVSIKDGESEYTAGVEHTYATSGDYVAYWGSSAREGALNQDGSAWRNETKINAGGTYAGNDSPITAVASVVQVPDNQIFTFDLTAVDTNGDNVQFRYGTQDEFYNNGSSADATKPTGLQLDSDGGVTWDVRDTEVTTAIGDRWQMTVMAEDLDSEGGVKSYVPLDFVFRISDSSDAPPTLTTAQDSHSAAVAETLNFSLEAVDPDWGNGDASPQVSVVNPPSADTNVWSTTDSSADATTTSNVSFTPSPDMNGDSFVVIFQATDAGGNATTKTVTINVALDDTTPSISSPSISADTTTATATWSTDEAGSSQVTYGLTSTYGTSTTEINTDPRVTDHEVTLSNLLPCTVYHYAVVTNDLVNNTATSNDATFTTGGCDSDTTPTASVSKELSTTATGTVANTVDGKGVTIDTPANVTSTSSSMVIQILALDSVQTLNSIGSVGNVDSVGNIVFDVKAIIDGTTILDSFDAPVTITYTYSDDEVAEFDESTLTLYHYRNNTWNELDDCSLDQNANTLSCTTENFSIFAPFGEKARASQSSGSSGGTRFGCKDPDAANYQAFSSHKPELCEYESELAASSAAPDQNPTNTVATPRSSTTDTTQPAQSATPRCAPFSRDLERGMEGEDVRCLQQTLNALGFTLAESGPGAPGEETIYFAGRTFDAVSRYQEARSEQVLAPIGLTAATGYFGPQTKAAIAVDNPVHKEVSSEAENSLSNED